MRRGACIIVPSDQGQLLAVTRGPGSREFGLPGGKCEPGETSHDAAKRELLEETGLVATHLVKVYEAQCGPYFCTCFLAWEWWGEPRASSEGDLLWVEPEELARTPPFASYNVAALTALHRSMGSR